MALTKKKKDGIIKVTRRHDTDTGSPEVQVSLLSRRIDELSKHLKKNRKDKHSRRGLLGLVADRRTHLEYLKKKNPAVYADLVKKIKE
ncbi:MAG: 30S ribosomal protein S15 [Patescibacteria group bacterium]